MGRQFDEVTRQVEDSTERTTQQAAETTEYAGRQAEDAADRVGREVQKASQDVGTGIRSARGSLSGSGVQVDVADQSGNVVVTADLPGFDREEIDATISGQTLRIVADHEESSEENDQTYFRRERRRNSVRRSIALPSGVSDDEADAEYQNGVLTVTIPKTESDEDGRSLEIN